MSIEATAARHGARVLFLTELRNTIPSTLAAHANEYARDVTHVRRSAGNEHIKYNSGGTIRYVSVRSPHGGRGYTADMVSLPTKYANNANVQAAVIPCMSTSPQGQLIIRTD